MSSLKIIATFSKGIFNNKKIKAFLQSQEMLFQPRKNQEIDLVVGWGKKANTQPAITFSKKSELPYASLEDGFIHSMGQGVLGSESCSLVVDRKGIYYDATQASDLEILISEYGKHSSVEPVEYTPLLLHDARAQNAIQRIIKSNISKYNNASLQLDDSLFDADEVVLVIDQTAGDMSLKYGHVNEDTFDKMLQAALDDYPNARIIVKTHPDVIVGKKKGNINLSDLDPRVRVISAQINPMALLKKVEAAYVATSQMGFEALMLEKHVVCFGVPFYAGWGLTEDRADKSLEVWSRRKKERTLEEVFTAAYIQYTRYLHPDTQQRCELEDILSYFELQYKNRLELSHKTFCINFTRWKQNHIKAFLSSISTDKNGIVFVSSAQQAIKKGFDSNSQLVTWASKNQEQVDELINEFGITPWQVEDGFIRSAGLGTDLTAPASLVLDKTGIYYDPTKPSDLETILQTKKFSDNELKRAELLKHSLLKNELSKYNLGKAFCNASLSAKPNQKIILIPGQVEGDASIIKGCIEIDSNTALIKATREENPDAYLIYKPHPDVVSGNRKGKVAPEVIQNYVDLELTDASITDCLAVVDEVHTMTSLVGFEGLIRGLKVFCYGLPFYSSWGLTDDRYPLKRRSKKLKLNELVAGTLIDYPLYINWQTGQFTTPEIIVEQLKKQIDKQGGKQSNQVFWIIRFGRKIKNFIKGSRVI